MPPLTCKTKKIFRAKKITRWNSLLVMLPSVLKKVSVALTVIQSRDQITNQEMKQVEGENIATPPCICPVAVGLM